MSSLVEHAKRELKLAGLFDKKSAYDGQLAVAGYLLEHNLMSKRGNLYKRVEI